MLKFLFNPKINYELKLGMILTLLYFILALFWPIYSLLIMGSWDRPYLPSIRLDQELFSPSLSFFLGTDLYGRSMVEILWAGLFYTLNLSITVIALSFFSGVILGSLSLTKWAMVRFCAEFLINVTFIIPSSLLAILLVSTAENTWWALIIAMVVTGQASYARVFRAEILRVSSLSYVEGAYAIGMTKVRLLLTILFPAIFPQLMIQMVQNLSGVIISEAGLSFLGLMGHPYSWGTLLSDARTVLLEAPMMMVVISISLGGLVLGPNLLGDGLRDYLDPHKNKKRRK